MKRVLLLGLLLAGNAHADPCRQLTDYQHQARPPATFLVVILPDLACRTGGQLLCNAVHLVARSTKQRSAREQQLIEACGLRTPPPMEPQ